MYFRKRCGLTFPGRDVTFFEGDARCWELCSKLVERLRARRWIDVEYRDVGVRLCDELASYTESDARCSSCQQSVRAVLPILPCFMVNYP